LVVNLELLVGGHTVVSRSIRTRAEVEGAVISSDKFRVIEFLPLVIFVDHQSLDQVLLDAPNTNINMNELEAEVRQHQSQEVGNLSGVVKAEWDLSKIRNVEKLDPLLPNVADQTSRVDKVPHVEQMSVPPHIALSAPKSRNFTGTIAAVIGVLAVIMMMAIFEAPRSARMSPTGNSAEVTNKNSAQGSAGANPLIPMPYEINFLLGRLSAAYAHKSMTELQGIWPQMGDQSEVVESEFRSAEAISLAFENSHATVSPDEQTATVAGIYHETIISNGNTEKRQGHFSLKLVKTNGIWLIKEAKFAQ
jgi:hypothetical protein